MMMTSAAFAVHNVRMSSSSLKRYVWLSICAALTTILLKGLAPMDAIVPTIASIVLGAVFGWLSEMLGGKLTKAA